MSSKHGRPFRLMNLILTLLSKSDRAAQLLNSQAVNLDILDVSANSDLSVFQQRLTWHSHRSFR